VKIVREKASKLVVYLFNDTDDVSLTESGMAGDIIAFDIPSATHEIVENVPAPSLWSGNQLTFNGAWSVNPDGSDSDFEARYNAVVPQTITRYQARVVLRRAGKIAALKTFLNGAGREEVKDAFEHLETFIRDSDFIAALGAAAGFTDAEVDQLFIDAAKI
jgi:hypothetical protein